ncbi:MAG: ABC transporter permease [Anaerolineaceae bacterium]
MKQRSLPQGFIVAASLLVLFVVLPIVLTFFSTTVTSMLSNLLDPDVARSIGITFFASGIASMIGVLLGLPLAYILARRTFRGKGIVEGLIDLPLIIPHTAAGIALLLAFGRQGILGKGFAFLGVFFVDTLAGVVVAMLFVSLPLLVNAARDAFQAVEIELEQSARVDGASPWKVFYTITLPLAWRGILSGVITMWARGISEFGAVAILAYNPKVVPVLIFERFQGFGLNSATPIAAILLVIVMLIFTLLRTLARRMDD